MKRNVFYLLSAVIAFCFIFTGCQPEEEDLYYTKKLGDDRFDGVFERSYMVSSETYVDTMTFNGGYGLMKYNSSHYEMEARKAEGKFRKKLWTYYENSYEWSEWLDYKFSEDGNTLTIQWHDYLNTPERYYVFIKVSAESD